MLIYILLFFALPIVGVIAMILFVGERSSDRTVRSSVFHRYRARVRPH